MSRKFPIVKFLVIAYCLSLISLLLIEGYDITKNGNLPSFVMLFIIPLIVSIIVLAAWISKGFKLWFYKKKINIENSFYEVIGVLLLQAAYCFGLTAAWYNLTSIDLTALFVYVFAVIIPTTIFLIYFVNLFRKRLDGNQIIEDDVVKKSSKRQLKAKQETKLDFDSLIQLPGFTSEDIIEKLEQSVTYNVPSNHKFYEVFTRLKIEYYSSFKALRLVIKLRSDSLLSLDIQRKDSAFTFQRNEFVIPRLANAFVLNSPTPNVWKSLFRDTLLKENLALLRSNLEQFSLKGQYIEAIVYSSKAILQVLNWVVDLNPSMEKMSGSIQVSKAEAMLCYNCQDPFDPLEDVCTKCGSSRPRCIVCFQDLKPEIDTDVVILPCCKIYAHKEHMIVWLRKKPSCPNCHADLSRWINKIGI